MTTLTDLARAAADHEMGLVRRIVAADEERDDDGRRRYSRNEIARAVGTAMSRPIVLRWLRAADAERIARAALGDLVDDDENTDRLDLTLHPRGGVRIALELGDETDPDDTTARLRREHLWSEAVARLTKAELTCAYDDTEAESQDSQSYAFWPTAVWAIQTDHPERTT